jgi:hypothetical protein
MEIDHDLEWVLDTYLRRQVRRGDRVIPIRRDHDLEVVFDEILPALPTDADFLGGRYAGLSDHPGHPRWREEE